MSCPWKYRALFAHCQSLRQMDSPFGHLIQVIVRYSLSKPQSPGVSLPWSLCHFGIHCEASVPGQRAWTFKVDCLASGWWAQKIDTPFSLPWLFSLPVLSNALLLAEFNFIQITLNRSSNSDRFFLGLTPPLLTSVGEAALAYHSFYGKERSLWSSPLTCWIVLTPRISLSKMCREVSILLQPISVLSFSLKKVCSKLFFNRI